MPVPSTQEIRKPLLEAFRDEAPHSFVINEILAIIAAGFGENLDDMSSTEKTALKNNINEAKTYLRKHKLLSQPSKNTYMITRAGSKLLEDDPAVIDDDYFIPKEAPAPAAVVEEEQEQEQAIPVDFSEQEFMDAPEEVIAPEPEDTDTPQENDTEPEENFSEEYNGNENENENDDSEVLNEMIEQEQNHEEEETQKDFEADEQEEQTEQTEDEDFEDEADDTTEFEKTNDVHDIEEVLANYNSKLSDEVLEKVANLTPDAFCMLVMDLLSKMGYRAFQNARYTSDAEGSDLIHGVILENKPGMLPIYVHARKLSPSKTVGRSDMLNFIDALADKGGKGIFATTGTFTKKAEISAQDEGIMLLDGKKLAGLMIAHDFCVNTEKIFQLKAIDIESFSEYED